MVVDGPMTAVASSLKAERPSIGLRVATYNIHGAVGLDGRYDLGRVIRVIDELEADIVGLQEVAGCPVTNAESTRVIADACGYEPIAGPNIVGNRGRLGNLLLSRQPVLDFRLLDLTVSPHEPRGAIDARIELPDGSLQVMVTHLGLRLAERRRQLARLNAAITGDGHPSIILGDFNAPGRWELRRAGLGGGRTMAFAPRSFPANVPILALDRIWARPDALLRSTHAHRSSLARLASDHLPVVASLTLPT